MNKKDKKISVEDMDKKPEKKGSKAPLIVGIVLCAILIPILIVNCALIISGFTNPDRPPSLFGMTPMIVLTDSMEPLIDKGDIIISKSVDPDDIQVGDVISFVDPGSSTNAILTHRVIAIDDDNEDGIRYATTAGDNNTIRDYERDLGIAKNAETPTDDEVLEALKTTDYGLCVYHANDDVVDQQTVNMQFEGGTTFTFSMNAFNIKGGRYIRLFGTEGELFARASDTEITVRRFDQKEPIMVAVPKVEESIVGGHGGGDQGIVQELYQYLSEDYTGFRAANIHTSVRNHMLCFAAEESRHNDTVVDIDTFMEKHALDNQY